MLRHGRAVFLRDNVFGFRERFFRVAAGDVPRLAEVPF